MAAYKTLYKQGESTVIEKKSRFLGCCAPVTTEEQALAFVAAAKDAHKTASHCVFAYSLRENNLSRYSDAGEPQGTAGLPVLNTLKHGEVTDAAIVVIRYFGGTLLGTGGLTRAYAETASLAVQNAGVAVMDFYSVYEVICAYPLYDKIQTFIAHAGATVENSTFAENITLQLLLPQQQAAKFVADITELTRGQSIPKYLFDKCACSYIE